MTVSIITNLGLTLGAGGGGGGLLLDSLSATAVLAYSSRRLRSAYSGFAMKVTNQNFSTSPTQDIGFVSNNLDTASLLAFVGSNQGSIDTWYDQSVGGGNNATATISQQAEVFDGSALVTQNGHVWAKGNTLATTRMTIGWSGLAQPCAVAIVTQALRSGAGALLTADTVGNEPSQAGFYEDQFSTQQFTMQMGTIDHIAASDTSLHSFIINCNSTSSQAYLDGSPAGGTDVGTNSFPNPYYLWATSGSYFLGELLFFNSVLGSTDIATIHSNWQSYWAVP